jgi:hypothetical protein
VKENFNGGAVMPEWEFHTSQSKDIRSWKSRIYASEDDMRECTFHPRTARNVPLHVHEARDQINAYGFIYGNEKEKRGIHTYIEKISPKTNHYFDTLPSLSGKKNYSFIKRKMTLAIARRYYLEGHFLKAMRTLESGTIEAGQQPHHTKVMDGFAVQQIADYYRCFHKGCGKLLDLNMDDKKHVKCIRCKGTYCPAHADPEVHNCAVMKEIVDKQETLKKVMSMKAGSIGALDSKMSAITTAIEEARKAGVATKFLNYTAWFLQQVEEAKKQEEEKQARGLGGMPGQQESDLGPKFLINNEEKFNDKAERALLNEVLKLAEQIRAARKAKARQHFSLEKLGQSLKQCGAVRLLERPYRNKMCSKALASRHSWSSEGGSKVPVFGSRPTSPAWSCGCSLAHSPAELRFPAGESVRRCSQWMEQALATNESRADCLPGSKAEWVKLRTPKDKDKDSSSSVPPRSRRSTSRTRRANSEPRHVEQIRQSLDEQAQHASQAQGLVARAKVHLKGGQLGEARRCVGEARALATNTQAVADAEAHLTRGGQFEGGPVSSPQLHDLRSQIRALACEDPLGTEVAAGTTAAVGSFRASPMRSRASSPGPMRSRASSREAEDVHQYQVAARREVYGVLEDCATVEAELEFRHKMQQRDDEAILRLAEVQSQATLAPSGANMVAPQCRAGERPQMCMKFLDTGTCDLGAGCPYAHHPAELSGHSHRSFEGLLQVHKLQDAGLRPSIEL